MFMELAMSFFKPFQSLGLGLLFSALVATLSPMAHADVEVAGVKFADTLDLKGNKLQLNGAGIRTKAIFKVYAAGLYLPGKASTPELAMAMQGAKSIRVTMLRDIEAQELGNLLVRGIEANTTRDEFFKFAVGFQQMADIFLAHKKLKTGDTFSLDFVPGTGAFVVIKGELQKAVFKEPEFFNSIMKIWLGPKPVDASLKPALLGKAPEQIKSPAREY
jgi:Chalcone isomerase-like